MTTTVLPLFQSFGALGTGISAFLAYLVFRHTQKVKREDIEREEKKRQDDRNLAQQEAARASWQGYLQFAFENPKYSSGYIWAAKRTDENEQYEWYVTRMLYACEGVLSAMPDDKHWGHVIENQFEYHANYLNSESFLIYEGGYSTALQLRLGSWRNTKNGKANA